MSDGNFNRSLLPSHSFQSGLRTGKAVMKTKALQAFLVWLKVHDSSLTDEQLQFFAAEYKKIIEG